LPDFDKFVAYATQKAGISPGLTCVLMRGGGLLKQRDEATRLPILTWTRRNQAIAKSRYRSLC
jgi:hypothetical protein